jgi:hypothetical protein
MEIFVKTQHFSNEAGWPGKNLQFHMQFATIAQGFEGWPFFKIKVHD